MDGICVMKIVVGIDDSPHSEAALKWVRDMRWPEGTLVTLISVPEVVSYTLSEASGAGLYEEIHQEQVRSCRELVARATTELPSEHNKQPSA